MSPSKPLASMFCCFVALAQSCVKRITTDQLGLSIVQFVRSTDEHTLCSNHDSDKTQRNNRFDPGGHHPRREGSAL